MISLKAQGIKALIPSALVSEGPRSKGLMAAILLSARTSSRDEDPGSEVTLGGRIIPFTCETAKKNSFSLNPPLTLFRVGFPLNFFRPQRRELRGYAVDMLFPIIFKLFAYVMGEVPADVFEDIQKDVRDMEGCFGFDLRWVHARLGAVAKARFDTHHLEEYAQTSAALEKATSALAQLEGELSRRSETASAHLVNNSVATKMKHFPLEGVVISPMKSRAQV
ncbi:hypothetical protein L1987_89165 [Smallanthus sonchifolius]|nr:hypothetical protein L1987_89165 [Smallanthus sonchifolius]